jgi:hypothetical protein
MMAIAAAVVGPDRISFNAMSGTRFGVVGVVGSALG